MHMHIVGASSENACFVSLCRFPHVIPFVHVWPDALDLLPLVTEQPRRVQVEEEADEEKPQDSSAPETDDPQAQQEQERLQEQELDLLGMGDDGVFHSALPVFLNIHWKPVSL